MNNDCIKELNELYAEGLKNGSVIPDETRVDFVKRECKKTESNNTQRRATSAFWNIMVNETAHLEKYDKNKKRLLAKLAKRKAARKN